jgi:hypothetical protein
VNKEKEMKKKQGLDSLKKQYLRAMAEGNEAEGEELLKQIHIRKATAPLREVMYPRKHKIGSKVIGMSTQSDNVRVCAK